MFLICTSVWLRLGQCSELLGMLECSTPTYAVTVTEGDLSASIWEIDSLKLNVVKSSLSHTMKRWMYWL